MKRLIILMVGLLQVLLAFGQNEKRDIHKGNELYQQEKYKEAEAYYKKSVDKSKASVAGNFNLADAWYKQKKYDDAAQKFADIAGTAEAKDVKAKAYHNLGNALLESKKLEESIEAYKKSLMNNPKDNETRYNLAYAQAKLKQQQQQQNKDKKDKDSKDKKGQNEKNKDQEKKDQDKDQKNKDQEDQNKNDGQQKDQKNEKSNPNELSKEDAERMLNALKNEERNTQEKMKNKKGQAVKGRIVKDW